MNILFQNFSVNFFHFSGQTMPQKIRKISPTPECIYPLSLYLNTKPHTYKSPMAHFFLQSSEDYVEGING